MNKARILIVEDEAIIAEDIRFSLEDAGYQIQSVFAAGEDALSWIKKNEVDLVLMDIMLAGEIDGVETAAKIRSHIDIPVIYLTSFTNEQVLNRAKITSPFGYIIKPFKNRELFATIEMALYKHQMERKLWERHSLKSFAILTLGIAKYQMELNRTLQASLAEKRTPSIEEEVQDLLEKQQELSRKLVTLSQRGNYCFRISDILLSIEILSRYNSGLQLHLLLEDTLSRQEIPGVHLDQVLMELLTNAWEMASPENIVTVTLEQVTLKEGENSQIPAGKFIRLQVCHTGSEFDSEFKEPFHTPFSSTNRRGLRFAQINDQLNVCGGLLILENLPQGGGCASAYLKYST